jgi:hypothetical protein
VFEEFRSATCLIVGGYSTRQGLKLSTHTCIIRKAASKSAAQFRKPLKGIEEFKSAICLIKGAYSTRQGVKLSTHACIIKKGASKSAAQFRKPLKGV